VRAVVLDVHQVVEDVGRRGGQAEGGEGQNGEADARDVVRLVPHQQGDEDQEIFRPVMDA
jgi:hypothetical protein